VEIVRMIVDSSDFAINLIQKIKMKKILLTLLAAGLVLSAYPQLGLNLNKPERIEELKDAGFGMFIHWSADSQLGGVISHSLVGASDDYINKYITELPQRFIPMDWNPEKIAILAKNAGMKYIVLTAKHHSGFCLWDTKTTNFNIMNTPYRKDILKGFVEACRKWGLMVGLYYSPEDFVYSYQQGIKDITRDNHWEKAKPIQEKYKKYVLDQLTELMKNYGPIDLFFIDSEVLREEVKQKVWDIQPNLIITRGAIPTPEQYVPGVSNTTFWESNMTMGTEWNYKPTNEHYKSGTELIEMLIETRAKGGSYLLNIGPDQWGNINEGQMGLLMEIGLWNYANHEAIQNVRSWIIPNEENLWLSKSKNENTVYVYITDESDWIRGDRKKFQLKSVKATPETKISVLGQTGRIIEYMPQKDGMAYFHQTPNGLEFDVVKAQRMYTDHKWPNPIVVKLENVEPAFNPAKFKTLKAVRNNNSVIFKSQIEELGDCKTYKIGFEYRSVKSTLVEGFNEKWTSTDFYPITFKGEYELEVKTDADKILSAGYEYRAILVQDGLRTTGVILKVMDTFSE
jgi:alpha-L-fucosidase